MKNYKYTILFILGILVASCSLEEEPPFLGDENVYGTGNDATNALTGIYQSLINDNYYGSQFLSLANLNSGFGVTKRGGSNINNIDNATICSLKPTRNSLQLVKSWQAIYSSIGRANGAIEFAITTTDPITEDEIVINDVVGQAYFIRAFNYFTLVRMWGEVPLRLRPTTKETLHIAKSSIKEVYAQIFEDIANAQELLNGSVANGTIKPEAASMLLAKVYMTLATAPVEHQETGLNYWPLAYAAAKQLHEKYILVENYDDLFQEATGNNSTESIFELQSSEAASPDHVRAFTPSNYINVATFGFLQAHAEVYDLHDDTYPTDPRLTTTYISEYVKQINNKIFKTYPTNKNRKNFATGFPFVLKLGERDITSQSRVSNKNFKIYRYADLLLMLAEISNELQNGEQLFYVIEVLKRVGLTPQAGYSGDQEAFRNAIMKEYQFELFFEGQDWFTNRRRGYTYFLDNIITPHNAVVKANVDVTLETDETTVMYLPIPQIEIDANQLIN